MLELVFLGGFDVLLQWPAYGFWVEFEVSTRGSGTKKPFKKSRCSRVFDGFSPPPKKRLDFFETAKLGLFGVLWCALGWCSDGSKTGRW